MYYNGHGDLAAEADASGARTALHTYTPFGAPIDTPPANSAVHRFTGAWDKQLDTTSDLVLMGARPYDPNLGRFLAVDPIDGGSLNNYDYAGQDPINGYDLTGSRSMCGDPESCENGIGPGASDAEAKADHGRSQSGGGELPIPDLGYSIREALYDPKGTIGYTSMHDAHYLFSALSDEGWTVEPIKKGVGIRAYDGKGNSIILERNVGHAGLPDFYWRVSTGGKVYRFGAR